MHLLRYRPEHTWTSAIYYGIDSRYEHYDMKSLIWLTLTPEPKILDTGDELLLSKLQRPWALVCELDNWPFPLKTNTTQQYMQWTYVNAHCQQAYIIWCKQWSHAVRWAQTLLDGFKQNVLSTKLSLAILFSSLTYSKMKE